MDEAVALSQRRPRGATSVKSRPPATRTITVSGRPFELGLLAQVCSGLADSDSLYYWFRADSEFTDTDGQVIQLRPPIVSYASIHAQYSSFDALVAATLRWAGSKRKLLPQLVGAFQLNSGDMSSPLRDQHAYFCSASRSGRAW